jgi:hypothetical protein
MSGRGIFFALGLVAALTAAAGPARAHGPTILATSRGLGGITLGPGPTRVPLVSSTHDGAAAGQTPLIGRLRSLGPGRRLYLELVGVTAHEPPGITYNVYLNLPPDAPTRGAADPHYLGTFGFFDVGAGDRPVVLDVTEPVKRLVAAGAIGHDAVVTVVPAGTPTPRVSPQLDAIVITAE